MDFRDAAFVRLADPDSRASVIDELGAGHLLDAAYDLSTAEVDGPFGVDITELAIPGPPSTSARIVGGWSSAPDTQAATARFDVLSQPAGPAGEVAADCVWRGAVVARAAVATSRVADVAALARGHQADRASSEVRVTFSPPEGPPPAPRRFPVTCAVVVDDGRTGIVDLLRRGKAVQASLREAYQRPSEPGPRPRHPVTVAWLVPPATFDDDHWPGAAETATAEAARAARRVAAARWLAPEGLAVVPVDVDA